MKKHALHTLVLLLTLPASATISYVQSSAQWSGTSSCPVTLSGTTRHDLIVVWAEWQTSGPNTVTVTTAADNQGQTLISAVGPTVQSTGNRAAQIFYVRNILGGLEQVTLAFSGTVASSACVEAEYSGADLNYPLDSSSTGYSFNSGTNLDSGYVAPAKATLMVFGAGIVDAVGTPTAGASFTSRQSNSTGFCALAEDNVTPTPATLQHANGTCTSGGNWIMQTVVFRDASSTVTGGWSPARPSGVRYADQFPGADACVQIANAFADLPSIGGTVDARGLGTGSNPLVCSVNPIPSGATGRLLLGSGTYLAQVTWVVQSNQVHIVGNSAGSTVIQACKSGQANCGGVVFPSGSALIQMGTSMTTVFSSTVKSLKVDCQAVPGVSGIQAVAAQEETVFDLITVQDCPAASFDLGLGNTAIQNGAALSNFNVFQSSSSSCGSGTGYLISSVSRSGPNVTANLGITPTPPPAVGQEVWIQNVADTSYNGYYRVNSVTSSTTFTYQTNTSGGPSSSGGTASFWPIGVRLWQMSGSGVRPIINGTINGDNCSPNFAPIAMELSGGDPYVHNVHAEGFTTGFQIGDLSGTNSATLTNIRPDNNLTNGVVISNQYQTSGGLPGALPTGNINIFNLDATGGTNPVTDSLIDQINNNTLTVGNNGTVSSYVFSPNGVFTTAVPETGLKNGVDINGQTVQLFSGSSRAAFSAASTAVAVGASAGASGLSINGGTPITSYIDGSQAINFGTISAQSCNEVTVAVSGAATTNEVAANPQTSLGANVTWSARVSSANSVAIRACNVSSTSYITASITWNIKVFQ